MDMGEGSLCDVEVPYFQINTSTKNMDETKKNKWPNLGEGGANVRWLSVLEEAKVLRMRKKVRKKPIMSAY